MQNVPWTEEYKYDLFSVRDLILLLRRVQVRPAHHVHNVRDPVPLLRRIQVRPAHHDGPHTLANISRGPLLPYLWRCF